MTVDAHWRSDLERWLEPFLAGLSHPARRKICPLYVAGLIGPGDRKSVQPMAARSGEGQGLSRFLDDGRLELDTNAVERAIQPITLNRQNALFAGGDEGGETWAVLASLIECCKHHQVEPQAYLTDNVTRLVNEHPRSRLAELTPWA